jgi:1-aminocyclopropane-1-carboxylate deaminase/D-cysteine desulfhydrase-like pyridoxal-dependent ACC family enzyme
MKERYRQILELLETPPSPLQLVEWPAATAAGVELYVKRDELLDPRISGNKWRKLLPQLAWELRQGATYFATVGGVHSNHIPAFAALLERLHSSYFAEIRTSGNQRSIPKNFAFVRGGIPTPLSPSLAPWVTRMPSGEQGAFAPVVDGTARFTRSKSCGLELRSATREQVRTWRTTSPSAEQLEGATWIPEGGTTKLGLLGMAACYREIEDQLGQAPDAIVVAVGSGGTAAGLARKATCPIYGMDVVGDKGLPNRIKELLSPQAFKRLLFLSAQLKGFASGESDILQTMLNFKGYTGIQLDPIYTAKALLKLDQLLWRGEFEAGSKVVLVHTGGLQGIEPWMNRYYPASDI